MKNGYKLFFIVGLVVCIYGCGGMHKPFSYAKSTVVTERSNTTFVQLTSGEFIESSKMKFNGKKFTINDQVIEAKDVIAYQGDGAYYAKVTGRTGFVRRIVKGKINVYWSTSSGPSSQEIGTGGSENTMSATYFVQKGDKGDVVLMNPKSLREMTKDNDEAYKIVNSMGSVVVNIPKMEKAVKIYNER